MSLFAIAVLRLIIVFKIAAVLTLTEPLCICDLHLNHENISDILTQVYQCKS